MSKKEKDLRKLSKAQLLEIMLAQSEEIDRLRETVAQQDEKLKNIQIRIQESGSIAEASLKVTHIFEEAQKAADLYLNSIRSEKAGAADDNHYERP